jgi:hypothetical protein
MSSIVSQETIAAIIANAYRSFAWGKRAYTWKTMLGYIRDIALEDFQLSLADLEASSRAVANQMTPEDYNTAIKDYDWQKDLNLLKVYNSIPYIFSVGDDNIITVVFNQEKRSPDCAIQELTTEMMEPIKYMGLVRMYIPEKTNFTIPFLPDNIIHLEINDAKVLTDIDANLELSFPRFLRGFIDNIGLKRRSENVSCSFTYTTRLPSNLFKLTTSCKDWTNLPSTLLEYNYVNNSIIGNFDLPVFDLFPIGIEHIKVLNADNRFRNDIIVRLSQEIIRPPKRLQYLEIPLEVIQTDTLVFGNIHTLYITWFYDSIKECCIPKGTYTGNLVPQKLEKRTHTGNLIPQDLLIACICGSICKIYDLNYKVILEDGLEYLILDYYYSLGFIKLIEYAPSSLKTITIKNPPKYMFKLYDTECYVNLSDLLKIQKSDINDETIYKTYCNFLKFLEKYPHVSLKLERCSYH